MCEQEKLQCYMGMTENGWAFPELGSQSDRPLHRGELGIHLHSVCRLRYMPT